MDFPTLNSRTHLFPILGLLGGIFKFSPKFDSIFCKQTVENLIRRRVQRLVCLQCLHIYHN